MFDLKSEYYAYLDSPEWKRKREQRLEIDGHKCVLCGATERQGSTLNVHHLTYDNMYQEDVQHDLVTLCRTCHYTKAHGHTGFDDKKQDSVVELYYNQAIRSMLDLDEYKRELYRIYLELYAQDDIEILRERIKRVKYIYKKRRKQLKADARAEYIMRFDGLYGCDDIANKGKHNFCNKSIGEVYLNKFGPGPVGAFILAKFYAAKHAIVILEVMTRDDSISNAKIRKEYGFSVNSISDCRKQIKLRTVALYLSLAKFQWEGLNLSELAWEAIHKEPFTGWPDAWLVRP